MCNIQRDCEVWLFLRCKDLDVANNEGWAGEQGL